MSIYEKIMSRRSVKCYKADMPPMEVIDRIIEAGLYAANGRNWQSPIVIAVTDKAMRDRIAALNAKVMDAEGTDPFYGAPAILIVLADKTKMTYIYDGSLMMGNMMLAAHDAGLGACWVHRAKQVFESDEGKEILASLGIEGDYEGIGNLIIGYADGEPRVAAERREGRVYKI